MNRLVSRRDAKNRCLPIEVALVMALITGLLLWLALVLTSPWFGCAEIRAIWAINPAFGHGLFESFLLVVLLQGIWLSWPLFAHFAGFQRVGRLELACQLLLLISIGVLFVVLVGFHEALREWELIDAAQPMLGLGVDPPQGQCLETGM